MKQSKPKLRVWNNLALLLAAAVIASPIVASADAKKDAPAKDKTAEAKATDADKSASTDIDDIIGSESSAKKANLRENHYYYGAFNRRDPFRALVDGTFVREDMMETVDLTGVELVGVVKGELDRFALLEDEKGFTYILRVGDKVRNGTVVAIGEQTLTARITNFGQTSKFTMHMVQRQKGDKR